MTRLTSPVVQVGAMAGGPQPEIAVDDELLLRPWLKADAAVAVEAFADEQIQRWHARRLDDEDEAVEWIVGLAEGWVAETCATWAILDRMAMVIVGRVSMYVNLEDGSGEVAYWVLPLARGRGVATRACVAATDWAHALGINRVQLEHSTHNAPSGRVARSAGFVEEGVRRGAGLHADGWHDMRLYSRLATDPT